MCHRLETCGVALLRLALATASLPDSSPITTEAPSLYSQRSNKSQPNTAMSCPRSNLQQWSNDGVTCMLNKVCLMILPCTPNHGPHAIVYESGLWPVVLLTQWQRQTCWQKVCLVVKRCVADIQLHKDKRLQQRICSNIINNTNAKAWQGYRSIAATLPWVERHWTKITKRQAPILCPSNVYQKHYIPFSLQYALCVW